MASCDEVLRLWAIASRASSSSNPDVASRAKEINGLASLLSRVCSLVPAAAIREPVSRLEAAVASGDSSLLLDSLSSLKGVLDRYARALMALAALSVTGAALSIGLMLLAANMVLTASSLLQFELSPIVLGLSIAGASLYRSWVSPALALAASALALWITWAPQPQPAPLIAMLASALALAAWGLVRSRR